MVKIPLYILILLLCTFYCYGQNTRHTTSPETLTSTIGQYPIVGTGQKGFFNNNKEIERPKAGDRFYGQDAEFAKNNPSYTNNGDGTSTDNITGLVWQKAYFVSSYEEAMNKLKGFQLAGYSDWQLPTIKELYSLINFNGVDASSREMNTLPAGAVPFIDTAYFDFKYGSNGPRIIDVQLLSSTIYKGITMGRDESVFGLNIADGRIKAYPLKDPRSQKGKLFTVRFVRGNVDYGKNNFREKDQTIIDLATGLMWDKHDSKKGMNWEEALMFVQQKNGEHYLGFSDWRLPNAKELQSIVDYSQSPQSTGYAAINPAFNVSVITDEKSEKNYPFYWTSTTHQNTRNMGASAVYICFGEALGYFAPPNGYEKKRPMDVHGAGAQRAEPKTGDPKNFPEGFGPQGDVIRIYNYVRLMRDNK